MDDSTYQFKLDLMHAHFVGIRTALDEDMPEITIVRPESKPFMSYKEAVKAIKEDYVEKKDGTFVSIGNGRYNEIYVMKDDPVNILRFSKAADSDDDDSDGSGEDGSKGDALEDVMTSLLDETTRHVLIYQKARDIVPEIRGLVVAFYYRDPEESSEVGIFVAQKMERLIIAKVQPVFGVLKSTEEQPNPAVNNGVHPGWFTGFLENTRKRISGPSDSESKLRQYGDSWFLKMLELTVKLCRLGLYHGDIHPGNMVMTTNGPKVIDFDEYTCLKYSKNKDVACTFSNDYGTNLSFQACAPESLFSDQGLVEYSREQKESIDKASKKNALVKYVDYGDQSWRAQNVIYLMNKLAIHHDDVDIFKNLPNDPSSENKSKVSANALWVNKAYSKYMDADGCDWFSMTKNGCFEASVIFSVMITTIMQLLNGREDHTDEISDVNSSLYPLSPEIAQFVTRCLHPLPSKRPKPDEIEAFTRSYKSRFWTIWG